MVAHLLWVKTPSAAGGRASEVFCGQRSIKSRISVSPMILSGTATRATKAISPSAGVFISYSTYPGVAQLVARLLWEQDAASSSLATRTKSPESAFAESGLFCLYGTRLEKFKSNADERCRRQLDGGEPLSAPTGADANESRHSNLYFSRLRNFNRLIL